MTINLKIINRIQSYLNLIEFHTDKILELMNTEKVGEAIFNDSEASIKLHVNFIDNYISIYDYNIYKDKHFYSFNFSNKNDYLTCLVTIIEHMQGVLKGSVIAYEASAF